MGFSFGLDEHREEKISCCYCNSNSEPSSLLHAVIFTTLFCSQKGHWSLLQHGPWLQLISSFTFSHSTENLPFVMIWLGSNESSPSFSPKHAYSVRTLLLEKENKINVFTSKTGILTVLSCNHTCGIENHAHRGLNTHFHMKTDYFSTVALNTCWHIFVLLMFYNEWKIPHARHQHAFIFIKYYTWLFLRATSCIHHVNIINSANPHMVCWHM